MLWRSEVKAVTACVRLRAASTSFLLVGTVMENCTSWMISNPGGRGAKGGGGEGDVGTAGGAGGGEGGDLGSGMDGGGGGGDGGGLGRG